MAVYGSISRVGRRESVTAVCLGWAWIVIWVSWRYVWEAAEIDVEDRMCVDFVSRLAVCHYLTICFRSLLFSPGFFNCDHHHHTDQRRP